MAVKMSGKEWNEFYNDPAWWPDGLYHEEEVLEVDGRIVSWEEAHDDEVSLEALPDNATVKLTGGYVMQDNTRTMIAERVSTLESYFKKWRKQQNTAWLVVKCDKDKVEQVKKAVREAGGSLA